METNKLNNLRDGFFNDLNLNPLSTSSPITGRKNGLRTQNISGSGETQAASGSISHRSPIPTESVANEPPTRNSKSGTIKSDSSVSADSLGSSVSHRKSFSGTNMHSSLGYLP